jgi:hypothetical protein
VAAGCVAGAPLNASRNRGTPVGQCRGPDSSVLPPGATTFRKPLIESATSPENRALNAPNSPSPLPTTNYRLLTTGSKRLRPHPGARHSLHGRGVCDYRGA